MTDIERAVDLARSLDPEGCAQLLGAYQHAHKAGYEGDAAVMAAFPLYAGSFHLINQAPDGIRFFGDFRRATAEIERLLRLPREAAKTT